jgi:propanediol dehydratase large subunit
MHTDITFDLQFIIGSFFGFVNTHDSEMLVTFNSKDDYERTLKFYIRDGKVMRFNGVGMVHDFNRLGGGIQAIMTHKEREVKNIQEVMSMVNKYPMFCEFNKARKNRTEIRLVDKRRRK